MRSAKPTLKRLSRYFSAEAGGKHVPWGALGEGKYSAATKGCFDVIARAAPLVENALNDVLDQRAKNGLANSTPFAIADFGTADGARSATQARHTIREREPAAPIVVHYEDQALNDWQSVFQLTSGALPDAPKTYMEDTSNVFVLASGTSFYEQCFAPCSIDLSFCATAMHWLTDVPCAIPDALHSACTKDPSTRGAFAAQAARDWERILLHRAVEMKVGGRFVVVNFAEDDAGQFLGSSLQVPSKMHENFSRLWHEVAGAEAHAATAFPNQYRSLEACTEALLPGTPAAAAGLELCEAKTDLVECPFRREWLEQIETDPKKHAANFVPTTRTWSNSTFVDGAVRSGVAPERAATLADEMFVRYEGLVAESPADHAMDYVHSYLDMRRTAGAQ